MLCTHGAPIVSVTLNVPGAAKIVPGTLELLYRTVARLREECEAKGYPVKEECIRSPVTGLEAFLAVDADAVLLKQMCIRLEEESGQGRFLDLDIYGRDGSLISRRDLGYKPRKCFLCENEAALCIRSRLHSAAELEKKFRELLYS